MKPRLLAVATIALLGLLIAPAALPGPFGTPPIDLVEESRGIEVWQQCPYAPGDGVGPESWEQDVEGEP